MPSRRGLIWAGIGAAGLAAGAWKLARHGAFGSGEGQMGSVAPERMPATSGPVTVTLLGTSLTVRGRWPDSLAAALNDCRDAGVAVRRVAKSGATSVWGRSAVAEALQQTQILVVEFTTNDASLHRGISLSRSAEIHREIIAAADAAGVTVLLATMNPAHGLRGWDRIGLPAYENLYRRLAVETPAGLIDTARLWAALPASERERLIPDGLHPNEEGMHRVTVDAFRDALAPLICAQDG